jgi:hypothetical protein
MSIPERTSTPSCALRPAAISHWSNAPTQSLASRATFFALARHGPEYTITAFGHLAPGNPYEAYKPPGASSDSGQPPPAGE